MSSVILGSESSAIFSSSPDRAAIAVHLGFHTLNTMSRKNRNVNNLCLKINAVGNGSAITTMGSDHSENLLSVTLSPLATPRTPIASGKIGQPSLRLRTDGLGPSITHQSLSGLASQFSFQESSSGMNFSPSRTSSPSSTPRNGYASFAGQGIQRAEDVYGRQEAECRDNHTALTKKTYLEPCMIFPHLYLGSEAHSSSLATLQQIGVTHIINVAAECENHFEDCGIVYKKVALAHNSDDLIVRTENLFDLIDEARERNSIVFVHCSQGQSRSASVVVAYVMRMQRWSMLRAYNFVRMQCPYISPNHNLVFQLYEYERKLDLPRH